MKNNHKKGVVIGVAALAAGLAGAYYLYGSKNGPERRKQLKSWMLRMKAEVMDELSKVQDLSESNYKDVLDRVANKYKKISDIDPAEVMLLMGKMQTHWKDIKKDLSAVAGPVPAKAKKAVKKTAKVVKG